MDTITLKIALSYDASIMHGDEPESIEWFFKDCLAGDHLYLHCNEIGDTIGTVKVLEIDRS